MFTKFALLIYNESMSFAKIPIGKKAPEIVNVVVEIPKGSHNKYEYDEELDEIKLDRVLYSAVFYPTDYGFIPETRSKDGDHLDVLIISSEPVFPGCIIEAKPISILYMEDEAGIDEKIIAISTKDPYTDEIESIDDVDKNFKNEIHEFFKTYKRLEHKEVTVKGWSGKAKAIDIIKEAQKRYQKELSVE